MQHDPLWWGSLEPAVKLTRPLLLRMPHDTKFLLTCLLACLQGIVGVATNPISGALKAASKTIEGIDSSKDQVKAMIKGRTSQARERVRLPRAIGADQAVRPYVVDEAVA